VLVDLLTGLAREEPGFDPWDRIAEEVDRVPSTDLDVDLAFYGGPLGQRGAIGNIREHNLTPGHLFRAAFRAMADNYACCADRLGPRAVRERVVFSGGLAQRYAALREEILAALKPAAGYRLCVSTEDTLRGLLTLALVCAGRTATVMEACRLVEEADESGEH